MYLLKAKKLHDKEVMVEYEAEKKERRAQRRQRRKERTRAREAAKEGEWQDMDFNCRYMGSFQVPTRSDGSVRKPEVKQGIRSMRKLKLERKKKPTLLTVSADGVSIWDKDAKKVAMAHAIDRILYIASDPKEPVVGLVAQNPGMEAKYCHVFKMTQKSRAKELHKKISEAFDLLAGQDEVAAARGMKEKAGKGNRTRKGGKGRGAKIERGVADDGAADSNVAADLGTIAESLAASGKVEAKQTLLPAFAEDSTGSTAALLFAASG